MCDFDNGWIRWKAAKKTVMERQSTRECGATKNRGRDQHTTAHRPIQPIVYFYKVLVEHECTQLFKHLWHLLTVTAVELLPWRLDGPQRLKYLPSALYRKCFANNWQKMVFPKL
jgi:hypothetical protein